MRTGQRSQAFVASPNIGELTTANASGRAGSMLCGAFLVVNLQIDENRTINAARFKVAGCMRLVEACGIVTQSVEGLSTADASAWARAFSLRQSELLGEPSEGREHCAALASSALLLAITSFSNAARQQWVGEDALICSCFGVSEETIENRVRDNHLSSIEEVTRSCNAGGGCRSCYPLIQEIIDEWGTGEWGNKGMGE